MEHKLLQERSLITARHDAALRRRSPDKTHPDLRRELLAVVDALEKNLTASEAAGLPVLELSRTTRWIADACADLARHQRIPHGEDRRWLVRALLAYHRAWELLLGIDAPRDRAVLAFNHANAIRRLDMEDAELLEAARARYLAALPYFEAHEPARAAEVQEALDALRVLRELAPPTRKAANGRADMAEVKAGLRSEEDPRAAEPEPTPPMRGHSDPRGDALLDLVNRVAEIVAALPPPISQDFAPPRNG